MAFKFWQLSGPDSHFERRWDRGNPNDNIADIVFGNFKRMVKTEGGLTLLVGIKDTGASQILVPESMSYLCDYLRKRKYYPYASSEFASVSPIYVETPQKLLALLTERQNLAKTTKAKKERSDISKANGKFCGGPRNLTRAQFERGRTFWQLITYGPGAASIYGLSHPWWIQSVSILSFAFSFWRPDGSGRVSAEHLLVASITEFDIQTQEQKQSWCYRIEEQYGLQNADELDFSISVATEILPQKEVVKRVQDRLSTAISRGPVVLLLHDFGVAEREQLTSLGFDVSKWVNGLGPLLGYNDAAGFSSKKEERSSPSSRYHKSRSRSRSPSRTYTAASSGRNYDRSPKIKREAEDVKDEKKVKLELDAPNDSHSDNSFYVISIVELYKAVTGKYWERIAPNVVFDMLTRNGRSSEGTTVPRNIELDSTHIMQAWLAMVKGPFIDEQKDVLNKQSLESLPSSSQQPPAGDMPENGVQNNAAGTREVRGLHDPQPVVTQRRPFVDPFNDDSESD